ncbi:MAG: hypothetical protein MPL62_04435 [Alphaproteobacteria bacterium]|nr:hypothetical protein [Alphaproteobacteria bacterium]
MTKEAPHRSYSTKIDPELYPALCRFLDNAPNVSATIRDVIQQYVEGSLTNSKATANRLDNLKATKLALEIWEKLKGLGVNLDIAGQIISGERRVPVPELTNANPQLAPTNTIVKIAKLDNLREEFIEKRQTLYDYTRRATDVKELIPAVLVPFGRFEPIRSEEF